MTVFTELSWLTTWFRPF